MTASTTRGQLLRFLMVGGCGFAIDILVFKAMLMLDGGLILSRFVSAGVAITVTWYMNRVFTFRTAGFASLGIEYLRYIGVQATGLIINLGCYFLLILRLEYFALHPIFALCLGAGLAIVTNFLGSKFWAFRMEAGEAG